jgi:hypothetical protein
VRGVARSIVFAFVASMAALAACSHSSPGPSHLTDTGTTPDDVPFVPDACKASLDQPADVTVGEGQTFYSDLTDNQVLTWEKGPQGGHHVWIALRMIGIRQTQTITTVDMEDQDLSPVVNLNHSRVVYDFNRDEGGHCTLSGLRMQLDLAGDPPLSSIIGHHIKVTATLQDPDGATAVGTKTIIVTGDPT